jgi:hypothetical protein
VVRKMGRFEFLYKMSEREREREGEGGGEKKTAGQ